MGEHKQGWCRRFPPSMDNNTNKYPITIDRDWCGEYNFRDMTPEGLKPQCSGCVFWMEREF
jgi:hypothetical protein